MKKYNYFIGIDVSKKTLDITLRNQEEILAYQSIENTEKAIEKLWKTWQQQFNLSIEETLICLENTGRYMNILLRALSLKESYIWVENATAIKRSMGLQRGKNDKVDAHRIAEYAFRHQDKARLYQPSSQTLERLKALQTTRKQLVDTKKKFEIELKESKLYDTSKIHLLKAKNLLPLIETLTQQIKQLDKQMDESINEDDTLKKLIKLITSVPGVGVVTAYALLVATEAFTKFDSSKQLACYCGIAPFEHSSGSSVRGKTRVSHFANKALKSLLHMCALSAIKMEGELKDYYQRKLKEGKQKMSALNAVRNKIIQRIFACVKNDRKYAKNYEFSLA